MGNARDRRKLTEPAGVVPAKAGTHTPYPRHVARPVNAKRSVVMGPRLRGDDTESVATAVTFNLCASLVRRVAVDLLAAHIGRERLHVRDVALRDRENVVEEHHEIGELAGFDRAFDISLASELRV